MDEMTVFEERLMKRMRVFARAGVTPIDAAAVAHGVALGQPRRRGVVAHRWLGIPRRGKGWRVAMALGLLVIVLGGALVAGGARLLPPPVHDDSTTVANGWIAFTVEQPVEGADSDTDIWFVALDHEPRRVIGSDTDGVNQLCPAFSPDGRSLAYGRAEGNGTRYFMNVDGSEGAEPARYRQAALVIVDVSDDGQVSERLTIDIGDALPPPCPVWSPNGGQVAFGVNATSPINPETSGDGSEVWVVTVADRGVTVLPDLLATDLEWSPDGSRLAIASGGNEPDDTQIHLYTPASGATSALEGTVGVVNLTWSPDGRRIAWAGHTDDSDSSLELRGIDVETGHQERLAGSYAAIHGIGPVWSPDGRALAFQRCRANPCGGERHEVVVLRPGFPSDEQAVPEALVQGPNGSFYPWRVTWSPDGKYLLSLAWETGNGSGPALVAIPADLSGQPVVVAQIEGMVPYDGYPDTTRVPIQTWGRAP